MGELQAQSDVVAAASPELTYTEQVLSPKQKPKQRRNKPTLSCAACVERKTKCDRQRPVCLACLKRQSECQYSKVANIIASASNDEDAAASGRKIRRSVSGKIDAIRRRCSAPSDDSASATMQQSSRAASITSLPLLLANLPHSLSTPSKIFGEGSRHPFSNYWTAHGGLAEVISVVPSKEQADILVDKYFEKVDAVYPFLNRRHFTSEYERYWSSAPDERPSSDPAFIALLFVLFSLATQFLHESSSEQERKQVAEFYASAAHQALRIASYLNSGSMHTILALLLMGYFLMNDNKASDAWGFGGILVRHAYAMGLNRDPEMVVPEASVAEKQQRRKLWQAVFFQDTFLTVILRLPPTTTFTDVEVDSLIDEPDSSPVVTARTPPVNPMSISSIAPSPSIITPAISDATPPPTSSNDTLYIRSMWRLANFVQLRICTPRALSRPFATSMAERTHIVSSFKALYDSYPTALNSVDPAYFHQLANRNPRQARQNLFLRSNFWHCMMLLLSDESPRHHVLCDVSGAVEAGRQGMLAFFNLWDYFRVDGGVWWVFQHRAFEEALIVAELLAAQETKNTPAASPAAVLTPDSMPTDYPCAAARQDCSRVLQILEHVGSSAPEMQKTRTEVLRRALRLD